MQTARTFKLEDYPHPDQDEAGQLILWPSEIDPETGEWGDCNEAVVVQASEEGWEEVLGAVAVV